MNVKSTHPLISCICITHNRSQMLINTIVSFEYQNYPNKELVISYPRTDHNTRNLIERVILLSRLNIIQVEREAHESLGYARNMAVSKATGDYICTWDDDDWYHPERLSYQMNAIQLSKNACQASIIRRVMLYDKTTGTAYLSASYNWSGTLLCDKNILNEYPYLEKNRLEDVPLIKYLESKKSIQYIEDIYHLYVYVNHGTNLLDHIHFGYFTRNGPKLSPEMTKNIRDNVEVSIEIK